MRLPEIRGLLPGIGMVGVAIFVAWVLRSLLPSPAFSAAHHGIFPDDFMLRVVLVGLNLVGGYVIPTLASLVMLWVAFIRADVRDRYLWSAIMILSTPNIAGLLSYVVPRENYGWVMQSGSAIDPYLVTSAVAYAAIYCALAKGMQRTQLGTIAAISMTALFALPLVLGFASWATVLCSLFATAGIWSIGVAIAEGVGFDVYGVDEISPA